MSTHTSILSVLRLVLLVAGLAGIAFVGLMYFAGRLYSSGSITRFRAGSSPQTTPTRITPDNLAPVNFSLWSQERVEHYKASLLEHFEQPVAILTIDKIGLEVPVFEGTSEWVLNRGVGRIHGTAQVGESGNVGIAGHRDGFFRGLKDVGVGDLMKLESTSAIRTYKIVSVELVNPDDVSVLNDRSVPELTLVTCFPFYFVGSAPQRFIVHASLLVETKTRNEPAKASLSATASRSKENSQ